MCVPDDCNDTTRYIPEPWNLHLQLIESADHLFLPFDNRIIDLAGLGCEKFHRARKSSIAERITGGYQVSLSGCLVQETDRLG